MISAKMARLYLISPLVLALSTGFPDQAVVGATTNTIYMISMAEKTWNEAREVCARNGGHLLTINSDTDWNLWQYLMGPDIDSHPRPSSTYWLGLHAPDPECPESFYWDTCDLAQYTQPLTEDINPTYHQCVYAWFYREVFNNVFLSKWLKGKPCNETHPFICVTQPESTCVSTCDEIVTPVTSEPACLDACDGNLSCTSSFDEKLGVCHLKVNRTTNQDYLKLCWLPSLHFNFMCTSQAVTFDTGADIVDQNINVTNGTCLEQLTDEPTAGMTTAALEGYTEEPVCSCSCETLHTFLADPEPEMANLTLEEKIDIMVKELTIDRKNTTSSQRRYVSVMDYRPSSVGLGAAGAGIIIGVFAIIVIIDLSRLWPEIANVLQKIVAVINN